MHERIRDFLAYLTYPVVMMLGIAAHFVILGQGGSLLLAIYLPVVAGSAAIWLMEKYCPAREAWNTNQDLGVDLLYLLVIQTLLPRTLAMAVGFCLALSIGSLSSLGSAWWPHHWPVAAQALLLLLIADFFRYWLHRLAHAWRPLWRFHGVHHAPDKLYSLNVGRFHPLDKSLQFTVDALPFLLLGVAPEVLGLYFVVYALHGFFQHSNVRLRLGFLNYLVSGPELHRWHHSLLPAESNSNYGNNLIVWDWLFGTRFLPAERAVGELGVDEPKYPQGFLRQLCFPWIQGERA